LINAGAILLLEGAICHSATVTAYIMQKAQSDFAGDDSGLFRYKLYAGV
jgi:hypothetical protein